MKYLIFAALLFTGMAASQAQNRIGIETGISAPFYTVGTANDVASYRHNSIMKPNVSMYYLRKVDRHVYLGGKLGLEGYDLYYSRTQDNQKVDIQHNSSYFTVTPNIDFGLGKHQYMHIYVGLTMGFLTSVHETTGEYAPGNFTTPYNKYNSSTTVSGFLLRPCAGLNQHFPLNHYWHITLNEYVGVLANDLTHVGTKGAVHPGYIMFQLGVMRKFHAPKRMASE